MSKNSGILEVLPHYDHSSRKLPNISIFHSACFVEWGNIDYKTNLGWICTVVGTLKIFSWQRCRREVQDYVLNRLSSFNLRVCLKLSLPINHQLLDSSFNWSRSKTTTKTINVPIQQKKICDIPQGGAMVLNWIWLLSSSNNL